MIKSIIRKIWPVSAEGSRREFAAIANEMKAARKEVRDGVNVVRGLERQLREMKGFLEMLENALVVDGLETRREVAMRIGGLEDSLCGKSERKEGARYED